MDVRLFGEVVVTLFVIIDPPGMVPIFLALTGTLPAKERNRAAWHAVALAGGVIVVFAVAGQQILRYLSVDLPALQAAGGILLLLVALELLTGQTENPDRQAPSMWRWCRSVLRCSPGRARSWPRCCSCSGRTESGGTRRSLPGSWSCCSRCG